MHEKYIKRCFELAQKGLGKVGSNPIVGCVIVANDKIIGEGWHQKYGEAHAEVNAFNAIKEENLNLVKEATVYVSLEPCAHYGKTPPCADLIIRKNVANVVIACQDPFGKVNGQGIQKIKDAGIGVICGILDKKAKYLIRRFITFHTKKRPYIILKWAESTDGFMGKENKQVWLTNEACRRISHKWRTEEDAILVGENTVLTDNPSLTVRNWKGQNPLRIAFQKKRIFPDSINIFNNDAKTVLFSSKANQEVPLFHQKINVLPDTKNFIPEVMSYLYENNIKSLIVEGGKSILQSFIDADLWDEARILKSNVSINNGIKAPVLNKKSPNSKMELGDNSINYFLK